MIPIEADSARREPEQEREQQDAEDPELAGRAEQDHPRVLEQRPEVGQRPDPDEDQQREELVLDAGVVQDREQAVLADHRRQRAGWRGSRRRRSAGAGAARSRARSRGRAGSPAIANMTIDCQVTPVTPASSWSIVSWLIRERHRAGRAARPDATGWPASTGDLEDDGVARRADRVAHLHRLEDEDRVAALERSRRARRGPRGRRPGIGAVMTSIRSRPRRRRRCGRLAAGRRPAPVRPATASAAARRPGRSRAGPSAARLGHRDLRRDDAARAGRGRRAASPRTSGRRPITSKRSAAVSWTSIVNARSSIATV